MTVARLRSEMSTEEYVQWHEFCRREAKRIRDAEKRARG